MTELLTAEQAKIMTAKKFITIDELNDSIKVMASAGFGFYCQRLEGCYHVIEDSLIEDLKTAGYKVEVDKTFFKISWL